MAKIGKVRLFSLFHSKISAFQLKSQAKWKIVGVQDFLTLF
jgi:hypothetical protein